MQVVCLISLSLATLLFFVRTVGMEWLGIGATGDEGYLFSENPDARKKEVRNQRNLAIVGLAIEDLPMFICQCIYVGQVGFEADSVLVVLSPLVTVANMLYFLLLRLPEAMDDNE